MMHAKNEEDHRQQVAGELSVECPLMSLPAHIRVDILNYLGETQHELLTMTLISKQVYKDCKQPGIEWKIMSSVEIKPRPLQGGSTFALMQQLRNHYHIMGNDNTRHFDHMKVIDAYKFDLTELIDIPNYFKMDSILSLDMSMSFSMAGDLYESPMPIVLALSKILPNLREINLSNISTDTDVLSNVSHHCPDLEKVTWNNIHDDQFVKLNGWSMRTAKKLKVIMMDDSQFDRTDYHAEDEWEEEEMLLLDLDNHRNKFLFYHCSTALERVSIRNANWEDIGIPQNALIKFVRNVPTLRWFRSNLTEENMNMLRLERPDIEFLN